MSERAAPISRIRSRNGLISVWRNIASDIHSPRVCKGLPRYVAALAETFWQVDPSDVVRAITRGDPAFFVAFQLRLDQIDCELVKQGRGIAERTPVIRAKYIVDGFRETAANVLVEKGGVWPPTTPTSRS